MCMRGSTKPTVFSIEQRTDRTTCFSGHVAMYVIALTPFTGKIAVEG